MSVVRTALVIGGGVAGPVTATALHLAGIEARVYEAYPGPAFGIGSNLALAPNGVAALDVIDAGDALRAVATPISHGLMVLGDRRMPMPQSAEFGFEPLRAVDRSDLHQLLHDRAVAEGVTFEYNKRLVRVDEHPEGVTAHFADGSTATADVLIGADGIRSTVRTLIDPKAPGAGYTGMVGFAVYLDSSGIELEPETVYFTYGKNAYYLYWLHGNGKISWGINLPHEYMTLTEARSVPAEHWLRRLRETYGEDYPAGEFVRRTTAENLQTQGALHIMPPVPNWYRGRMVLVGDAVHAPSNSSGQGASLAIESSIQLARCLRDFADPESAFAAYVELRRNRVEGIAARAAKINHSKTPGMVAKKIMPMFMPLAMKMMNIEKTMRTEQGYRIDWDVPVQRELAAA
ncbi:FAD-dependent oxidoreductase [Nocardia arthritidis]|uniref:FAD-dependent monooxygenase n=1 Tax=Nocardia arthritidis TaxID=228602 RepID=A0A6G9Y8B8_9NOCA|nr:FAD-dependent monooxygenase [Nocardia arthritidis]QIS09459.1 FAD-dependent monooxygenase [Nocardia arthritidis]